jgi:8-oxo-dGTP diphosphatase
VTGAAEARVWLVRHAEAGRRDEWTGKPDSERPLTPEGWLQAARLLDALRPYGVEAARRVLSSPYVRCLQTVEPLAAAVGQAVDDAGELIEGAPLAATLQLIATEPNSVMSTHGDVVGNVVERLDQLGLLEPRELVWAKGSTWILRLVDGELAGAEYVPPPPTD